MRNFLCQVNDPPFHLRTVVADHTQSRLFFVAGGTDKQTVVGLRFFESQVKLDVPNDPVPRMRGLFDGVMSLQQQIHPTEFVGIDKVFRLFKINHVVLFAIEKSCHHIQL